MPPATGIWWIILHFGGRAVGYPIGSAWLLPVLAGIFLVLGLGMAAMATSGTLNTPKKRHSKPLLLNGHITGAKPDKFP